MKKKLMLLTLGMALVFGLASCADNNTEDSNKPGTQEQESNKDTENKETGNQESENTEVEDATLYTTKVLLPDGTYLKDFKSQWCNSSVCFKPSKAKDGIAKFNTAAKDDMNVHILDNETPFLDKYAYNLNAYTVTTESRDIEVQLYDLKAPKSGDGTKENPYIIDAAAFNVSYTVVPSAKGLVYFKLVATKDAKYEIESTCKYFGEVAENRVDANLRLYTPENTKGEQINEGGYGKNFKTQFDAKANSEYTFAITTGSNTSSKDQKINFNVLLNEVK